MKKHKSHSDELNWSILFCKTSSRHFLCHQRWKVRKKNDKRRRKLFQYAIKRWGGLPLIPEYEVLNETANNCTKRLKYESW